MTELSKRITNDSFDSVMSDTDKIVPVISDPAKLLCKDCLHCIPYPDAQYYTSYKCSKFRGRSYVELVTGTVVHGQLAYCASLRREDGKCGPGGKYFKRI